MQNLYVTQAVAAERIHTLYVEAERDRRYRLARGTRRGDWLPRSGAALARLASDVAVAPSRARRFILAGQLRTSMYGARPC